jgi:hypothetical protein
MSKGVISDEVLRKLYSKDNPLVSSFIEGEYPHVRMNGFLRIVVNVRFGFVELEIQMVNKDRPGEVLWTMPVENVDSGSSVTLMGPLLSVNLEIAKNP